MSSFFGIYDVAILAIILLINIFYFKRIELKWYAYIILAILYIGVLPYFSAQVEVIKIEKEFGAKNLDGMNYLLIYLRWPTYWVLGIVQLVLLIYWKNKFNTR
ncbi:MAG: hypothetical protein PF487_00580 [Bacteroidales bacterium]|jgi:hypothetical protein|nr:hypothetical protein [Bacteroidales bacterium]